MKSRGKVKSEKRKKKMFDFKSARIIQKWKKLFSFHDEFSSRFFSMFEIFFSSVFLNETFPIKDERGKRKQSKIDDWCGKIPKSIKIIQKIGLFWNHNSRRIQFRVNKTFFVPETWRRFDFDRMIWLFWDASRTFLFQRRSIFSRKFARLGSNLIWGKLYALIMLLCHARNSFAYYRLSDFACHFRVFDIETKSLQWWKETITTAIAWSVINRTLANFWLSWHHKNMCCRRFCFRGYISN